MAAEQTHINSIHAHTTVFPDGPASRSRRRGGPRRAKKKWNFALFLLFSSSPRKRQQQQLQLSPPGADIFTLLLKSMAPIACQEDSMLTN